ncbi:thioredoxin domain-containing protein 5-like protein [Dinothrombium tinctorium]|uniref:Thioredoxin domain-containing protein 5-like protein n=1 Tax=Dinothrombium tinctorium TaxID=1965070 RepID=A0A443QA92_9ACAR|nr:thioredoxin domain-containing protein 5-like protein [Dinothrombium tinctorium]
MTIMTAICARFVLVSIALLPAVYCWKLSLTEDNFKDTIDGKHHVFVKFYAPWCLHCQQMEPAWFKLMEHFNTNKERFATLIARVNCVEQGTLCRSENVQGYPTIKLYRKGESTGIDYDGPRDFESLKEFLVKQLNLEEKKGESVKRFFDDEDEDNDEEESETVVVDDILRAWDEEAPDPVNGLYELNDENYERFLSKGRHFIKFYAPWCGHCQRLAPIWDLLANSFQHDKSVFISKFDCDAYPAICQKYEVKGYPTLLWIVDGKVKEKYSGARTHEDLKKFVDTKKKEDISETRKEGKVRSEDVVAYVTDSNFKAYIKSGLSFVQFFTPWCVRSRKLAPIWEELGKKLLGKVRVAKVDCSQFDNLCNRFDVEAYPTLIAFKDGQKLSEYEDERDLKSMFNFISGYLPSKKDEL